MNKLFTFALFDRSERHYVPLLLGYVFFVAPSAHVGGFTPYNPQLFFIGWDGELLKVIALSGNTGQMHET